MLVYICILYVVGTSCLLFLPGLLRLLSGFKAVVLLLLIHCLLLLPLF